MSKITDALDKAQHDRSLRMYTISAPAGPNDAANGASNVREELTWSPQVLRPRRPESVPAVAAPTQEPAVRLNDGAPHPVRTTDRSVMVTPATQAGQANGTASVNAASCESVDQAIELVKRQLETCEQQAARHTAEQLRLKAHLAASEQLQTQMTQEQSALRQQVEAGAKAAASIESTKAAWVRQLESLRECQVLSHAVRRAIQELKANAAMVTYTAESQRTAAEELAHYQQRGHALQQQVDQLQFRLGQALACAGTTNPVLADVEQMRSR